MFTTAHDITKIFLDEQVENREISPNIWLLKKLFLCSTCCIIQFFVTSVTKMIKYYISLPQKESTRT